MAKRIAHERRHRRSQSPDGEVARRVPGKTHVSKPAPLFNRLALIGVGLIGSSIARAARAQGAVRSIVATARSAATRKRVAELGLADQGVGTNPGAVKGSIIRDMGPHLPKNVHFVPAHPVAGTEYSGPDAGFAELFVTRWCILHPPAGADAKA